MSRIRLLAVTSSLSGGGAERQMVLLLRHLDRTRFAPTLCLFAETGPFLRDVPDDVPIIGLGKQSRWDGARVIGGLAELLRKHRPDLILSKLIYPNIVANCANLVSFTKTPVVAVEEGVLSATLATSTHPRPRRVLARWAYRRSTSVVVPSPGVAEDLRSNVGVGVRTYTVIPNMVEIAALERDAAEGAGHPFNGRDIPLVVAMGRLVESKGQQDLIAAIALLKERRPCNLLLIGDGVERERLHTLARRLGVRDRVKTTGFVVNPFRLMAHADVFVSPSHWESFGNAIVEAMALGIPVVSTRVPFGPEWIVTHGVNGLFAEARRPSDLADRIEQLLGNPAVTREIADGGRKWARQHCDAGIVVAQYEALLEEAARRA